MRFFGNGFDEQVGVALNIRGGPCVDRLTLLHPGEQNTYVVKDRGVIRRAIEFRARVSSRVVTATARIGQY